MNWEMIFNNNDKGDIDGLDKIVINILYFAIRRENIVTLCLVNKKWNDIIKKTNKIWIGLYKKHKWKYEIYKIKNNNFREIFKERCRIEKTLIYQEDSIVNYIKKTEHPSLITVLNARDYTLKLVINNNILMDYLLKDSTILELTRLLFTSSVEDLIIKNKRLFNYALQTLSQRKMLNHILKYNDLLESIFGFLDSNNNNNNNTNGDDGGNNNNNNNNDNDEENDEKIIKFDYQHFSKIVDELFEISPDKIIVMIEENSDLFVDRFINHFHDCHIANFIYRLLSCKMIHQWIYQTQLIPKILYHFIDCNKNNKKNVLIHQNILKILTECREWKDSIIVIDLLNNQLIIEQLFLEMEKKPNTKTNVIHCIEIIEYLIFLVSNNDDPLIITPILDNISLLISLLNDPNEMLDEPNGFDENKFGFVRLSILNLFSEMLYIKSTSITEKIYEKKLFRTIFGYFFKYELHNIVHCKLVEIFNRLFCQDNDELIINVLIQTNLIERIYNYVENDNGKEIKYCQGHFNLIINNLFTLYDHSIIINEFLEENYKWMNLISNLNETNFNDVVYHYNDAVDCFDDDQIDIDEDSIYANDNYLSNHVFDVKNYNNKKYIDT